MAKVYAKEEVAKHNTDEDLWLIVDGKVYDVSEFIDAHPGGNVVLQQVAGQDATEAFYNLHRHEVLVKYADLCIGTVEGVKTQVADPKPGDISPITYAEPLWLSPEFSSPYYNESHRRYQKALRIFVDEHVVKEAREKEQDGTYISQELIDKMAANGLLAARLGPGKHMKGRMILDTVKGEEYDYFHDMITSQELSRTMARGFQDGNMAGMSISLSAVHQWLGDEALKEKVSKEVLSGQKKMCLAVTEAFAGSDVSGIRTTAELSEDGKHWIVSGTKKWITNGMFSDYFVTACRYKKGMVVLLIPRSPEVETKQIKTSYSTAAGTAYIQFDCAKVPRNHLLGREDNGLQVVLSNFNHERWMMAAHVIRASRYVVEEVLKWTHQRIAFGKPLINQAVVRHKLASMISDCEADQAWLESITHQMCNMSYAKQSKLLGGPIALLKVKATRTAHEVADAATEIFGGRSITQSGMGNIVESFHRCYKFDSLLGGTESILADLGVRQAVKNFPKCML